MILSIYYNYQAKNTLNGSTHTAQPILPLSPIRDIIWYYQKKVRHTLSASKCRKEIAKEEHPSGISFLQLSLSIVYNNILESNTMVSWYHLVSASCERIDMVIYVNFTNHLRLIKITPLLRDQERNRKRRSSFNSISLRQESEKTTKKKDSPIVCVYQTQWKRKSTW
jgi:hypothetical protein